MPLARYIEFETQSTFTNETFNLPTATSHIVDPLGEDITGDKQFLYPRTAGVRVGRAKVKGKNKFSGTFDMPLYPVHATSLIYYTMGAVTTVENTPITGVHTHTITQANTTPFFQCAIGRDLREHQYVGGAVNSMTLDYTMDDVITASFDVFFRRELANATLTTSTTYDDFNVLERGYGGAEASVDIDATADDRIESLSISYENDFDDDAYSLGSQFLPAGLIGELSCTGSFDMRFESIDAYDKWFNETSIQIELTSAFGASSSQRSIKADLPSVALDTTNLPTSGFDRYVQSFNYHAEPDSNSDPLIVTVVNAANTAAFAA
jgi:hypothetical protein